MRKLLFILLMWSTAEAQTRQNPHQIYDCSDFARDEFSTGAHLWNWFDGTADPKSNPSNTSGYATNVRLFRSEPYPKGIDGNSKAWHRGERGYMAIFDMAGDKDMFKIHGAKTQITDIYGLQIDGDRNDTLDFYRADTLFEIPEDRRWLTMGRNDSLMHPFARLIQGTGVASTLGWNSVTGMTDSMRYVLVVLRRYEHKNTSGDVLYTSFPTFSELVIYGNKMYDPATINNKDWLYTGPLPKCPPIRQFGGVNNEGIELSEIPDGVIRDYGAGGDYDSDTTDYPLNHYNANPFSYSTGFYAANFDAAAPRFRWETLRAGSKRLEKYGWGNVAKSLPVTNGGLEPADWHNYDRYGNFWYHYAAFVGNNSAHTDAEFRWINKTISGYGKGWFDAIEAGNEDQAGGTTPLDAVVMQNVAYDGYEGRVANAGMKLGDSTMKFIMPATIYIDTSMYASMIFLCRLGRTDHKIIWDYFNGHHYSRKYPDPSVMEHDPTYEEALGAGGATPEEDNIYRRLTSTMNVIMRETNGDTTKKFLYTEFGYDNWVTKATTVPQLSSPWTISTIPQPPAGEDSLVRKGKLIVRSMSIFATTHISACNEYNMTPAFYDPHPNGLLFYSAARGAADTTGSGIRNSLIPTKWPNYWAVASFYTRMANYAAESVIALDSIGKCVIKWRNVLHADSVCYEIWKGSNSGSTLGGQSITVGDIVGNANKYTLSYTTAFGATTLQAVSSGVMSYTATEEPTFYFVQEVSSSANSFIKHHKKTIFVQTE